MSSDSPKPLILPLFANTVKTEWSWKRLDDIADVYDCPHSTPQIVDDYSAPYVVRSQDVRTGRILLENTARVSLTTYQERIKRVEPRFGDLVYSREGTYFGIAAEVPRGVQVCLGQRMVLIRPDASIISHSFLKYWLNSPLIFGHIHGFRDGTVAERLNLPVIRGLAVAFPTLAEQTEIAKVLSTLDDRITLLRETNTTLEAIAQTLFKSWFVDFDSVRAKQEGREPEGMDPDTAALFPDSFEESELGLVPKGWRVGLIDNIAIIKGGKQLGKDAFDDQGLNPVFGGAGIMGKTNLSNAYGLVITVGRVGAYCGQFFLHIGAAWVNNNASHILPRNVEHSLWLYQWLKSTNIDLIKKGAAQPFVSNSDIAMIKLPIPGKLIMNRYVEIIEPVILKIHHQQVQAQTLATLRDTLLPRLISGQLRLPDAEAMVEEAAA